MPEEVYVTLREARDILKRPWNTLRDWARSLEGIHDEETRGNPLRYRLADLAIFDHTRDRRQRWRR
jgi:hypothetical protein